MDINVKGVMYGTQVAAQHMVATGNKGHIIIMGSLASVSSVAGNGLYSASKHATRVIARVFHEELAQHGSIRLFVFICLFIFIDGSNRHCCHRSLPRRDPNAHARSPSRLPRGRTHLCWHAAFTRGY